MALRMFLGRVGRSYDEMRGMPPYGGKRSLRIILDDFGGCCCYCDKPLTESTTTEDHLVAVNKSAMGLHAWGNVVPSCEACNSKKHHREWRSFLQSTATVDDFTRRAARIEAFQAKYRYAPGVGLEIVADTLYEEVGALAVMLIELKIKRAQSVIAKLADIEPRSDSAS